MTAQIETAVRPGTVILPGRTWTIFAVTSLAMLFAQATVYAAFGIAVFAMAGDLGWSASQAGGAFTLLVIACCIAALSPVALIRLIGARWTMIAGGVTLALAYLLAASTHGLAQLYVAAAMSGAGFSLCANVPAIYLIAGWSGPRAARLIGLYMMLGAAGGAVGPPVAQALIASSAGWRGYWLAIAIVALLIAVLAATCLREPPRGEAVAPATLRAPMRTILTSRPFLVMAAAMVATQICVVAVASVTPAHLAARGFAPALAAQALGAQGLLGALATGLSGFLTRRLPLRRMMTAALLCEAAGMLLLAAGAARWQVYGFVPAFGIGSCLTSLATTVLLVEYFGETGGTTALATTWMLAGAAAVGPPLAGWVADTTGSFAPALAGFGLLLVPVAAATLLLPPPDRARSIRR